MGVQEIYDKLRTAPQHRASSVELFDEMTLQAGDVVTVSSDGQNYSVPIYSQDIHWTGAGMTVLENTGNEKREPLKAQKRRDFATNKRGYGNSKRQDGTDKWIEDFENTDLWVNQDTIWAVSGAYQVWTDPVSGVKHIQLKDGALLEVDRGDGVYSTVGTSYGIAQVNNEVVNVIEGSALWTQRNNITGVCGEFTVITDTQTGKKRLKIANGTGLVMTRDNVEYGVYDDGNLTGGIVVGKLNGQTGTYVKVQADKIDLSGYVTATSISADIADIRSIMAGTAVLSALGVTTAYISSLHLGSSDRVLGFQTLHFGSSLSTLACISDTASTPGNLYVGLTATELTGADAGKIKISFSSYSSGDGSATFNIAATATYINDVAAAERTGYNNGKPISGTAGGRTSGVTALVHDFTITKGDGTTTTLQIDCTSIYSTARTGYTLGTFALTTVTLQAASTVSCYREISGTGTWYYKAGTAVTVYPGDGGSFTPQGSAYGDITPIGTPVWFKQHSKTETPTGTWYTYHTSDPGGTTYKRFAAGAVIKNLRNPGSGTKYARGTGYDITPINNNAKLRLTATQLYPAGSSDSTHYYTKS